MWYLEIILGILIGFYAVGCVISAILAVPFFYSGMHKQAWSLIFFWPLELIAILRGAK